MKIRLVSAVLALLPLAAIANDATSPGPRGWTDEKSGKTIQATILDKKPDASSALLKMADGKEVWVEAARLVPDDRKFIEEWTKPFQYLTVTKEKDDSGKVTGLMVKVVAKDAPIAVVAKPAATDANNMGFTFFSLQPGETKEFDLPADVGHEIKVSDTAGNVLSKETHTP